MTASGQTPSPHSSWGGFQNGRRNPQVETPNWEDDANDECLDDIYHVLRYMKRGYDRHAAIQQRSKDSGTTSNTVFDACARRLYGVGNRGIRGFDEDVRQGIILNVLRRRFSLSPHDVEHFRRIL